jgi:hypothetical protein
MSEVSPSPPKPKSLRRPHRAPKPSEYSLHSSTETKCAQCDSIVETYSSPEATFFSLFLSALTILIFGIWSIFLLPFVIPLSKAIVIRCVRCDAKLEVRQPFGLFSLQDEVLTIKCGECALVVSRSYLLTATAIISCLLIYSWATTEHITKPTVYLNTSWPEYLSDCGGEVVLKNSIRVTETFNQKYDGNTISWDGFFMRATVNYGWFRGAHAVVILVKMNPSESDIHADLILSMDDDDFQANYAKISGLERGSRFKFNATFVSPGNEEQLHHLHAHFVEKIEGFMDIPPHVHSVNQRYNLNPKSSQPSLGS